MNSEFQQIFEELKKIFKQYEKKLTVQTDTSSDYVLIGPYSEKFKRDLWFGAVQIKKNYVSFHLMPVYMYAELTKEIPQELKKRMQGKSCFNFKKYDKELLKTLKDFSDKSFTLFMKRLDNIDNSY